MQGSVKHIGLKSIISNQILKKYSTSKTVKTVRNIKLTIPKQGIRIKEQTIYIPCLKLTLPLTIPVGFTKINQIEIGTTYAYISATYPDNKEIKPKNYFGVDLNTTKHVVVAANTTTGKVLKLGKRAHHIHQKYKHIRKRLQKQGKYKKVKEIKNRESRIIRDLNHKISKKLVDECVDNQSGIVFEELKNIRQRARTSKRQRSSLHSWSYYQLQTFVEYKAKQRGIPVFYVAPQYTSQRCCRCGHIESSNRKSKSLFQCNSCGRVEDADVNAGFNIASLYQLGIPRFTKDRDLVKGSTDAPREAMV